MCMYNSHLVIIYYVPNVDNWSYFILDDEFQLFLQIFIQQRTLHFDSNHVLETNMSIPLIKFSILFIYTTFIQRSIHKPMCSNALLTEK